MNFTFVGQIENINFSKTNAQGRKRYKRKLKPKTLNKKSGILAHKEDRERVRTGVQVAQETRRWISTAHNIGGMFR